MRCGFAFCWKADSCPMKASETDIGIFQRSSDFFAALNQSRCSSKIPQASRVLEGGAVAHADSISANATARTVRKRGLLRGRPARAVIGRPA